MQGGRIMIEKYSKLTRELLSFIPRTEDVTRAAEILQEMLALVYKEKIAEVKNA